MAKVSLPGRMPGVRRIASIPCSELPPNVMMSAICRHQISIFSMQLRNIPFAGDPVFKRERTLVNGRRVEKSTLEFRTSAEIDSSQRLAFIVRLVDGTALLIGSREPNYPVVEEEFTAGSPSGDAAVTTVKISHYDIRSAFPVIL